MKKQRTTAQEMKNCIHMREVGQCRHIASIIRKGHISLVHAKASMGKSKTSRNCAREHLIRGAREAQVDNEQASMHLEE